MQAFTVENVVYQRDVYGNIHAVSFHLQEKNVDIHLAVSEVFVENGDVVVVGFERIYKSPDNGKLNFLYIIERKKLYISDRSIIVSSSFKELIKSFLIIGLIMLFFDFLMFVNDFLLNQIFNYNNYFFSDEVVILNVSIFFVCGLIWFFLNMYNGSKFYISKFIEINFRNIHLYEAQLCVSEKNYYLYDFNKINNIVKTCGTVDKVAIQSEIKKAMNQSNYQFITYESDIDERKMIIGVDGRGYYFNVDYFDVNLGRSITFYCNKNNNEIVFMDAGDFYYINLSNFKLWSNISFFYFF